MASKHLLITNLVLVIIVTLLFQSDKNNMVEAKLSPNFYARSCPMLLPVVRKVIGSAIAKEARMGASILHLFFIDCFVFGCDGSILLDDTSTFKGEQSADQDQNFLRGFDVIENIKSAVEKACFGVVSCADILTIAARDSVQLLGGPTWQVELGRRDSKTVSQVTTNNSIPAATWSLSQLISSFSNAGFSLREMVALSGAHTIGQARCKTFRTRIYNKPNIDPGFATLRQRTCPRTSSSGDDNLAPLDVSSPVSFDNNYFKNLMARKGLLHSDQELFNGGSTDSIVREYNNNPEKFKSDFAAAMIKMGRIKPLTGRDGVIRMRCGRTGQMIQSTPSVFSFVT